MAKDSLVSDLVFSMLAVQRKELDWAFSLSEGLEREGFFDFSALASLSTEDVAVRLEQAGFDRGDYFLGIFSLRLHGLAQTCEQGSLLEELSQAEVAKDAARVEKLLLEVWGVGPVVVRNYRILRGLVSD